MNTVDPVFPFFSGSSLKLSLLRPSRCVASKANLATLPVLGPHLEESRMPDPIATKFCDGKC